MLRAPLMPGRAARRASGRSGTALRALARGVAPLLTALSIIAGSSPHSLAQTAAPSSFTFFGSGLGHGIGMSQWGTYGLAKMGQTHEQILERFFSGTAVSTSINLPSRIRVGLATSLTSTRLKSVGGTPRLWEGAPLTGTPIGSIPYGETWTVKPSPDGSFQVLDASGAKVGAKNWGSKTSNIYLTYADTGAKVFIPEADQVWYRGFAYARGSIEFNSYTSNSTCCSARMILRIPFEEYLLGLGEVPSSWPAEALAAQVNAARTYAAYVMTRYGLRSSCNCHITDGSADQVYAGYTKESESYGKYWVQAVASTRGEVVTYQGSLIQTFYTASDGGHTENVEDVWHGGDSRYAVPYLRGVCDPGEAPSNNPWVSWKRSYTSSDATSRLRVYTGSIGTVTGFASAVRGVSGRIMEITVKGTTGQAVITGSRLRAAFSLPDGRVWVDSDRNISGAIREMYDGMDCSPGLPASAQLTTDAGARQLFQKGTIYRNGTAGVTVFLGKGALLDEYLSMGEVTGRLGYPLRSAASVAATASTSGALPLDPALAAVETSLVPTCAGCDRADFAGGSIFYGPTTGAFALWGPILATYLEWDGPNGPLGLPTSRVMRDASGYRWATFEHSMIACRIDGVCRASTPI